MARKIILYAVLLTAWLSLGAVGVMYLATYPGQ